MYQQYRQDSKTRTTQQIKLGLAKIKKAQIQVLKQLRKQETNKLKSNYPLKQQKILQKKDQKQHTESRLQILRKEIILMKKNQDQQKVKIKKYEEEIRMLNQQYHLSYRNQIMKQTEIMQLKAKQKGQHSQLKEQCLKLERTVSKWQKQCNSLENLCEQLQKKCKSLQINYQKLQYNCEYLQKQYQQAQVKSRILRSQNQKLISQYGSIKSEEKLDLPYRSHHEDGKNNKWEQLTDQIQQIAFNHQKLFFGLKTKTSLQTLDLNTEELVQNSISKVIQLIHSLQYSDNIDYSLTEQSLQMHQKEQQIDCNQQIITKQNQQKNQQLSKINELSQIQIQKLKDKIEKQQKLINNSLQKLQISDNQKSSIKDELNTIMKTQIQWHSRQNEQLVKISEIQTELEILRNEKNQIYQIIRRLDNSINESSGRDNQFISNFKVKAENLTQKYSLLEKEHEKVKNTNNNHISQIKNLTQQLGQSLSKLNQMQVQFRKIKQQQRKSQNQRQNMENQIKKQQKQNLLLQNQKNKLEMNNWKLAKIEEEQKRALKFHRSMNTTIDHLWCIKQAEYQNLHTILTVILEHKK